MAAEPLNTFIGAGVLSFKEEGELSYRDFGFVSSFTTTPAVTPKDFMQKRSGIRSIARHEVVQQDLTIAFVLNEANADNWALYFMGTQEAGSPYTTVHIMDRSQVKGALRFVGDNAFGVKCQVDIPDCSLMPGGGPDWLTDDWLGLEIHGVAFRDLTTGDFGTVLVGITEEVP